MVTLPPFSLPFPIHPGSPPRQRIPENFKPDPKHTDWLQRQPMIMYPRELMPTHKRKLISIGQIEETDLKRQPLIVIKISPFLTADLWKLILFHKDLYIHKHFSAHYSSRQIRNLRRVSKLWNAWINQMIEPLLCANFISWASILNTSITKRTVPLIENSRLPLTRDLKIENLTVLNFTNLTLHKTAFEFFIQNCPKIEKILLPKVSFNLSVLTRLINLKHLETNGPLIGDSQFITRLSRLEILKMNPVNQDSIPELHPSSISNIHLKFDPRSNRVLSLPSSLETLYLNFCEGIDLSGFKALKKLKLVLFRNKPKLETLNNLHTLALREIPLPSLEDLHNLTELKLNTVKMEDNSLFHTITWLKKLTLKKQPSPDLNLLINLEELSLITTPYTSQTFFRLTKLKIMELYNVELKKPQAQTPVPKPFKLDLQQITTLNQLSIRSSDNITINTSTSLSNLMIDCPHLKVLRSEKLSSAVVKSPPALVESLIKRGVKVDDQTNNNNRENGTTRP